MKKYIIMWFIVWIILVCLIIKLIDLQGSLNWQRNEMIEKILKLQENQNQVLMDISDMLKNNEYTIKLIDN